MLKRGRLLGASTTLNTGTVDSVAERSSASSAADDRARLARHLRRERTLAGASLLPGNALTLLKDGPATYDAMLTAVGQAHRHIYVEAYILADDEVGNRIANALIERCRAGVIVRLLYDAVGCLGTPAAWFEHLRECGLGVIECNPVNPLDSWRRHWRPYHRNHRKLLVIDGHTAFVGGINFSDVYASSSATRASIAPPSARASSGAQEAGWRDTHVQVEGPVVMQLEQLFRDDWRRQGGDPLPRAEPLALEQRGSSLVRAVASEAGKSGSPIHRAVIDAIAHAQRNVWITNAYFVPDLRLRRALVQAARRGVDVRLLLPGHSDSATVMYAGRARYGRLLRAGVRIYEGREPVIHAKTATVDGVWSTVGSANLDPRSILHNDEANVVVLDPTFAAELEAMFTDDLAVADEVTAAEWRRRPWYRRLLETAARLVERWL